MKKLFICLSVASLMSCGEIRAPETYVPEEIDASDRDDAFDVETIGGDYVRNGNTYEISYNGEVIGTVTATGTVDGHNSFDTVTEGNYVVQPIAINGTNVEGFAVSGFDTATGLSDGDFGLKGTETGDITRSSANYDTIYLAANASDPETPNFNTSLVLQVDFVTGEIYGQSVAANGNPAVTFSGQLYGNAALVNIQDLWGSHDAEAGFYGDNGAEFAGGFANGNVSGLFYGEVR